MNITWYYWLLTLASLKEEHLWLSSQSGGNLKLRGEIPDGNGTIRSVKETFSTMRQNGEDEGIIIRMIPRGHFMGYPPYTIRCYVVVDYDIKLQILEQPLQGIPVDISAIAGIPIHS